MPRTNPTGHVLTRYIDLFKLWNKWTLTPIRAVILLIRTTEIITAAVVWGYCKPQTSATKKGGNKQRFFITRDSLLGTNVDACGGGGHVTFIFSLTHQTFQCFSSYYGGLRFEPVLRPLVCLDRSFNCILILWFHSVWGDICLILSRPLFRIMGAFTCSLYRRFMELVTRHACVTSSCSVVDN